MLLLMMYCTFRRSPKQKPVVDPHTKSRAPRSPFFEASFVSEYVCHFLVIHTSQATIVVECMSMHRGHDDYEVHRGLGVRPFRTLREARIGCFRPNKTQVAQSS